MLREVYSQEERSVYDSNVRRYSIQRYWGTLEEINTNNFCFVTDNYGKPQISKNKKDGKQLYCYVRLTPKQFEKLKSRKKKLSR